MRDTRGTLERWNAHPWPVLRAWFGGALMVASMLLFAVWLIASVSTPDVTPLRIPGVTDPANLGDIGHILFRNSLVLALHGFACVAGFIAGSSLVLSAEHRSGLSKLVHEKARPIAFAWVALVTDLSPITQACALGLPRAHLPEQLGISTGVLLLTILPHAIPELVAPFLL